MRSGPIPPRSPRSSSAASSADMPARLGPIKRRQRPTTVPLPSSLKRWRAWTARARGASRPRRATTTISSPGCQRRRLVTPRTMRGAWIFGVGGCSRPARSWPRSACTETGRRRRALPGARSLRGTLPPLVAVASAAWPQRTRRRRWSSGCGRLVRVSASWSSAATPWSEWPAPFPTRPPGRDATAQRKRSCSCTRSGARWTRMGAAMLSSMSS
mmetsp:Transcript_92353/g.197884  ORF Transcript_92353/g.197884 Transcript_92353/m.197884 type:complete len:214 (+) Transcript_92353:587-1228(+)